MKYLIFLFVLSCAPSDATTRAKNAITVEEYRERLVECKNKGKDAGSLLVYQRCSDDVDIQYGLGTFDGGRHD